MKRRFRCSCGRFGRFLLVLGLLVPVAGWAQTKTTETKAIDNDSVGSDALPFLKQVLEGYSKAVSYHIESIEEDKLTGELNRSWSKSFTIAMAGPGNRYRFEKRSAYGNGVQVSDGQTEWIYYPPLEQYIQQTTPTTGPGNPIAGRSLTTFGIAEAQRTMKTISGLDKLVRTATYGPEEIVEIGGKTLPCAVVHTEGELPVTTPIIVRFTFWIDKQSKAIRKMTEYREGPLRPDLPLVTYVNEREVLYTVADLAADTFSEDAFRFKAPITARLVKNFEDKIDAGIREFVGKTTPEVSFEAADGKQVSLRSFQGKPLLMDFWATWCAPCVESLPSIEKLYGETSEKGLVILSIDQDDEAKKASDFWTAHKEPWANLHGTKETLAKFPEHGIPYFVLIDASGKVVYSGDGLNEEKLRAALAEIGVMRR